MKPETFEAFVAFQDALHDRLEKGEKTYGNLSFTLPPSALIGEIEQELLDVAGWAFIGWQRCRALRQRAEQTERPT